MMEYRDRPAEPLLGSAETNGLSRSTRLPHCSPMSSGIWRMA
ncbi:hypothetical protein Sinac_6280 [Singulisphaera acidiphila DSM 18658]|uniref:Uncharacterized protein n=1 Tax=Singulisphaera acidiphila (strain ATCC BAA-1392 / DSM 18658 / VKM B-2454 / MOB10) TaxID=886293 RepID=L0DMA4_SINAD|nr:hypothetical protein Sinac_6280 [Singulisphaera acidiphila DSM 18658]